MNHRHVDSYAHSRNDAFVTKLMKKHKKITSLVESKNIKYPKACRLKGL